MFAFHPFQTEDILDRALIPMWTLDYSLQNQQLRTDILKMSVESGQNDPLNIEHPHTVAMDRRADFL